MANEITVNASLSVNKSPLKLDQHMVQGLFTMAGTRYGAGVQTIGFAAHELIVVPADLATAGWAWFKNVSATNFVQIGLDVAAAFVPFVKLQPGEFAILPLAVLANYAKADTGAVALEWRVLER